MRTLAFLGIGALITMIIASGCSNSSRPTAPIGTSSIAGQSTLQVPNNDLASNSTRFTTPSGTLDNTNRYDMVFLKGTFFQDKTGCTYLEVGKDQFIDLVFLATSTNPKVVSGQYVGVYGFFAAADQAPQCQLGPEFDVKTLQILTSDKQTVPPATPVAY